MSNDQYELKFLTFFTVRTRPNRVISLFASKTQCIILSLVTFGTYKLLKMSHAVDNSELLTTMSRSPHSQVVFVLHVQAVHNIDTPMFQDVDCSVCV